MLWFGGFRGLWASLGLEASSRAGAAVVGFFSGYCLSFLAGGVGLRAQEVSSVALLIQGQHRYFKVSLGSLLGWSCLFWVSARWAPVRPLFGCLAL